MNSQSMNDLEDEVELPQTCHDSDHSKISKLGEAQESTVRK